ncbi:hypothetical protein NM688_g1533 [Phlebia brevispora]|uniref:Uncharacterized protein n=1 Tax=Phlebia brevispora TaxID=194682 RepID=A0ACC1TBE8_9APHY|nr:hypothetical protein NM688_g1533 [Phlebia brevispora]
MNRTSAFIWKRARENVISLPPLPEDMNEPAYASLMFDTFCHVRLSSHWSQGNVLGFASEILPIVQKKRRQRDFFHVPHVEALLRSIPVEELESVVDKYPFTSEGWRVRQDMQARLGHAELCAKWEKQTKDSHQEELDAIRTRWYAGVVSRLQALGWGPELAALKKYDAYDVPNYPGVMEAKVLTDSAWQKIQGPLVDRMKEVRDLVETFSHNQLLLEATLSTGYKTTRRSTLHA